VVCAEHTIGSEIVLDALMELLGEWVMWNLVLVHLKIVFVSVQYWCTVCIEYTIGSKIVLDEPDDTPW
jgi:hypothetical protein